MKPLVYVAGPYTSPDPVENTHRAIKVGTALLDAGVVVPYVPHLSLLWHLVTPRPYETWLAVDLDVIDHCALVARLHGPSSGADGEVRYAHERAVPFVVQGEESDEEFVDVIHAAVRSLR